MNEVLKRTWAEISMDALEHNYKTIKEQIREDTKLCCVIKADAYGHGAVRVAALFEALGADYFGVSNLEEALQLRLGGIKTPILIMGYTPAKNADILAKYDLAQCIYSAEYAAALSHHAARHDVTVRVHIKIDTGMNRLGFDFQASSDEGAQEIRETCRLPGLDFEGIFTHFAVSDEGEDGREFTLYQFERFSRFLEELARDGVTFRIRHCANSAAVLEYPETHMDMVRAGLILYGLYPSGKIKNRPLLLPALELKSVVSHVKTVHSGYTVSYGREYAADADTRIATVPIGYADGYSRILGQRHAEVLIGGARCAITGRVCMDQLMVDVSRLSDVKISDTVTLIGTDCGETILADELAVFQESINYEVICDIGKRVPRVYLRDGKVESVANQIVPDVY